MSLRVFEKQSSLNSILYRIWDSIFDSKPQNIGIGLFEPIRLPADENPRRSTGELFRLLDRDLPLKRLRTFAIPNRGHRRQGRGVAARDQTFYFIHQPVRIHRFDAFIYSSIQLLARTSESNRNEVIW